MGESLPLDWRVWQHYLSSHPDRALAKYVTQGIRDGFWVGFDYLHHHTRRAKDNMRSALIHPTVVREYLTKECAEGRVLGPFNVDQFPQAQISRFGVIPKGSTGKWRLILDLSSPEGFSVNDGINPDWCSMSYVTVEQASKIVTQMGRRTQLAKVDIKSAYRIIPIHPEDRLLLGMLWDGRLFIDAALPFGLRSAPRIFSAVADVLEWRAKLEGVAQVLHYLDDFLVIAPADSQRGEQDLRTILSLFKRLQVPVAPEKIEGPSMRLTFLGIEMDTENLILRLPVDKLTTLKEMVREWLPKKACTLRDLQSLAGKLQHACKVVRPGRTFLRRVFELLKGCKKRQTFVRLNAAIRSDLMWWHLFLDSWNGVGMMDNPADDPTGIHLHTDASGHFGCGAWCGSQWFQLPWSSSTGGWSIAAKELVPVVLAGVLWGKGWQGRSVVAFCDNAAVVEVVNAGYSKDPLLMQLLRCLFFVRAQHEFSLRSEHPREAKYWADAISRDNLALFFSQVPGASKQPTVIPEALVDLVIW